MDDYIADSLVMLETREAVRDWLLSSGTKNAQPFGIARLLGWTRIRLDMQQGVALRKGSARGGVQMVSPAGHYPLGYGWDRCPTGATGTSQTPTWKNPRKKSPDAVAARSNSIELTSLSEDYDTRAFAPLRLLSS